MKSSDAAAYQDLLSERDAACDQYMAMIKTYPPVRERTKEEQSAIDRVLGIYQKKQQEVWHFGIL